MNPIVRPTATGARPPRYPRLSPRERKAVESVWAAEQAGRPTRLADTTIAVLTARELIYVVHFERRRFAHLTARGAVVLGLDAGSRK